VEENIGPHPGRSKVPSQRFRNERFVPTSVGGPWHGYCKIYAPMSPPGNFSEVNTTSGKHYYNQYDDPASAPSGNFSEANTTSGKHYHRQTLPQANTTMIQQAHPLVQRRSTLADVLLRRVAQDPFRAALSFLADADTVRATLTYAEQEPALCSETLAILQYTSGSTATPKGEDVHLRRMACDPPALRRRAEAGRPDESIARRQQRGPWRHTTMNDFSSEVVP
jgi:hypothetical protein